MTRKTYAHTEDHEGFLITLELLPEYETPDWDFETEQEKQEVLRQIDNEALLWFCAKVSAWKTGIELGIDYLSECCYATIEDFIKDGCFSDMKENAIREARAKIEKIIQS